MLIITGVMTVIATVHAALQCQCEMFHEQNVFCKPGNDDIVLRRGVVSDTNMTTGITLKGCRIIDLDFEAFKNDFCLEYIDLSKNKIRRLRLGVLNGNEQVTHLNLSHNMLTTFPLGLFDQKINLEVLDLKGNKLNFLELGVFDPLIKLVYLDLSSNNLLGKNIDPNIFDFNRKIKFMIFSRNNMSESPELLLHSLEALDFLNLDRCSLTEVPAFATSPNLRTMRHLILSTNQIRKLDKSRTFMNLDNLEILNLADNAIEEIAADVFTCCVKRLKMIVLRNNRIKTLSGELFQNLDSLRYLDLSHNLIEYVPLEALHGTEIQTLMLSYNKFTYLEANFIIELRNVGVYLAKLYVNDNPWQCACLKEIIKEMKERGVRYNKNKWNGVQPVCVTTREFYCKRQPADNDFYVQMYVNDIENK